MYMYRQGSNAWFNFTSYHSPPGTSPALQAPGVGNCLKRSCPGGRGAGQIENINFLLFHFSVDTMALDHVEKIAFFHGKSLEIVNSRLVREEYSLKIKICIRRYVNYSSLNKCAFDGYSNGWRSSQTKKYFFSVFIY